jgi:hypothetical protein
MVIQHQTPTFYPPPPAPFSSRQDSTKIHNSNTFSYSSPANEQQQQQQQGYQPYRFDSSHSQQNNDHFTSTRYESQIVPKTIPGKSSLSINNHKSSHPPIPRQFLQANINGSQSLRQHQTSSYPSILPTSTNRSPYPSTFTVQPTHFTSYSHNFDNPINTSQQQQQTRRIGYTAAPVYPTSRNYFHLESPANV